MASSLRTDLQKHSIAQRFILQRRFELLDVVHGGLAHLANQHARTQAFFCGDAFRLDFANDNAPSNPL